VSRRRTNPGRPQPRLRTITLARQRPATTFRLDLMFIFCSYGRGRQEATGTLPARCLLRQAIHNEMPVILRTLAAHISRLRARFGLGGKGRPTTDSTALAVDAVKAIYDLCLIVADLVRWVGGTCASTLFCEGCGFVRFPGA